MFVEGIHRRLSRPWAAWCRARGLACVEVAANRRGDTVAVRLDMPPAGRVLSPAALVLIGRACSRLGVADASPVRWWFGPSGGYVQDLPEEAGRALAAELVAAAADPRCVGGPPEG